MLRVEKSLSGHQYFVVDTDGFIVGVYYKEVSANMYRDSKNKKIKE